MSQPLLVMATAYMLLFVTLLLLRVRAAIVEHRLRTLAMTRARDHLAVTFPFNVYDTRRGANYSLSQLSRFIDRGVAGVSSS